MKVIEEKIMEVAFRLFKQGGIRSTSLQLVARECGISYKDIKLLFKSKKDLMLAAVEHSLNKKVSFLLINTSLSPSAITELNNFFKFIDNTIADLGPEILNELSSCHPLAINQLREHVENMLIPSLRKNIDRGLREGFYRSELDSELLSITYFSILRTMLESEREWTETRKLITYINDIFLHGVLNVKGMRI